MMSAIQDKDTITILKAIRLTIDHFLDSFPNEESIAKCHWSGACYAEDGMHRSKQHDEKVSEIAAKCYSDVTQLVLGGGRKENPQGIDMIEEIGTPMVMNGGSTPATSTSKQNDRRNVDEEIAAIYARSKRCTIQHESLQKVEVTGKANGGKTGEYSQNGEKPLRDKQPIAAEKEYHQKLESVKPIDGQQNTSVFPNSRQPPTYHPIQTMNSKVPPTCKLGSLPENTIGELRREVSSICLSGDKPKRLSSDSVYEDAQSTGFINQNSSNHQHFTSQAYERNLATYHKAVEKLTNFQSNENVEPNGSKKFGRAAMLQTKRKVQDNRMVAKARDAKNYNSPSYKAIQTKEGATHLLSNTHRSKPIKVKTHYDWNQGREALQKFLVEDGNNYTFENIPYKYWHLEQLPTLGASQSTDRYQEIYKAIFSSGTTLFLKKIPYGIWKRQHEEQIKRNGVYVSSSENYINEAAAQAFLTMNGSAVAPRLIAILKVRATQDELEGISNKAYDYDGALNARNIRKNKERASSEQLTHIVILSEYLGMNLLEFMSNVSAQAKKVSCETKRRIQLGIIDLVNDLHHLGIAHLDLSPQNILVLLSDSSQKEQLLTLKLCDFGKCTPLWIVAPKSLAQEHISSHRHYMSKGLAKGVGAIQALRYIVGYQKGASCGDAENSHITSFPFYSCIPTIGKGSFTPPECWSIIEKSNSESRGTLDLQLVSLKNPISLETLENFFPVEAADVFMTGTLLCWVWTSGYLWDVSCVTRDSGYSALFESGFKFSKFFPATCGEWPASLENLLQKLLDPTPYDRLSLRQALRHSWFKSI